MHGCLEIMVLAKPKKRNDTAFWTEGVLLVHMWLFCWKGGGVFTLCSYIGGASDRHVVLLTERRCCFCDKGYSSSRAFFQRGADITL